MVARMVRDHEVVGSNPVASTTADFTIGRYTKRLAQSQVLFCIPSLLLVDLYNNLMYS